MGVASLLGQPRRLSLHELFLYMSDFWRFDGFKSICNLVVCWANW
jgi:hypothetical protein